MDFNYYQEKTEKTAKYKKSIPKDLSQLSYLTMGLAGEAGEVANKMKKIMRDEEGLVSGKKKTELAEELGDVLWYVAQLCSKLNIPMENVAKDNIKKLAKRYSTGKDERLT